MNAKQTCKLNLANITRLLNTPILRWLAIFKETELCEKKYSCKKIINFFGKTSMSSNDFCKKDHFQEQSQRKQNYTLAHESSVQMSEIPNLAW